MSLNRKIRIEDLSKEIQQIIDEYYDDAYEILEDAGKKVSEKARTTLKNESKAMFNKNVRKKRNSKGKLVPAWKYANGWSVATSFERWYVSFEIHNRNQPTLTHLLERGHALPQGGRWDPPKEHIAPVREIAMDEYVEEVINDLSRLQ